MARIVLKTARDRDQYVIWGSIVDDVIAGPGTRTDAADYLRTECGYTADEAEVALARVDERGSSDISPIRFGSWHDDPLPCGEDDAGRYELARDRLADYADALAASNEAAARALLVQHEQPDPTQPNRSNPQ